MSVTAQYHCDLPGCDAVKREANHWYAVHGAINGSFIIYPWSVCMDLSLIDAPEIQHFCGAGHALKYISSILGGAA